MNIKAEHFPRIAHQFDDLTEQFARESLAASLALIDDGIIEIESMHSACGILNTVTTNGKSSYTFNRGLC